MDLRFLPTKRKHDCTNRLKIITEENHEILIIMKIITIFITEGNHSILSKSAPLAKKQKPIDESTAEFYATNRNRTPFTDQTEFCLIPDPTDPESNGISFNFKSIL